MQRDARRRQPSTHQGLDPGEASPADALLSDSQPPGREATGPWPPRWRPSGRRALPRVALPRVALPHVALSTALPTALPTVGLATAARGSDDALSLAWASPRATALSGRNDTCATGSF